MYPAPIRDYFRPKSIEEARMLSTEFDGAAMYLAGGMSLMQALKSRLIVVDALIDLAAVPELHGIEQQSGAIHIGAMTRYRDVIENAASLGPFQALSDAANHVGDRQVRNRGTVGGSLSWNYVSACTPIAALGVGAYLELLRTNGARETVMIDQFLKGPMTTALRPGDLLLSVSLRPRVRRAGSAYMKWGIVTDALPVVGVAVYVELAADNRCAQLRFAVGGLPSGPQRSEAAELQLRGVDISDERALDRCAEAAAADVQPSSDPWISADYKTHLIARLGRRVLAVAIERARSAL